MGRQRSWSLAACWPRRTRCRPTSCSFAWPWPSGARPAGTTGCCSRQARSSLPSCPRRGLRSSACWWSAGSVTESAGGSQDGYRCLLDDAVDEPVLDRLFGGEEEIAIGVTLDPLQQLTGVLGDQLVENGS